MSPLWRSQSGRYELKNAGGEEIAAINIRGGKVKEELTELKEFVIPKDRKSMDGLPFTPEGYEKAKSVFKEHYGNDRKVEKAYVKDILDLPDVSGNQSPKIQFYEWLL